VPAAGSGGRRGRLARLRDAWLAVLIGWGLGGAAYGLLVAFRLGLAGDVRDSLLLMGYVGLAFACLGSLLAGLRAGVRAVRAGLAKRPVAAPQRSLAARVLAALGGQVLGFAVLLAASDFLLHAAFRPDTSRPWLALRAALFLSSGLGLCWLLAGPGARRVDDLLRRLRDPGGWRSLSGGVGLLLAIALLAPLLGADSPRWSRPRSGAPADLERVETGLRVLVFGVDGATWSVVEPLLDAGQLPVTRALVEGGARATPRSPPPQVSPAIWTSLVTGRRPEEHGVRDYLLAEFPGLVRFPFESAARDASLGPFFLVGLGYFMVGVASGIPPTRESVRVKSLWHMLEDAGRRSLVLGWPATWPAEALSGVVVSDRFGPGELELFLRDRGPVPDRIHPPEAEERLARLRVDSRGDPRAMLARLAGLAGPAAEELIRHTHNPWLPPPVSLLLDTYDADRSLLAFLRAELAAGGYRLALVMLNSADMAMHAFWAERFPGDFGRERADRPEWGRLIDGIHALLDQEMGAALEAAGEDTVVIVVSDHGLEAAPGNPIWPGWHAEEALLILAGGPVKRGVELDRVDYLDLAPTILHLLGLPVPGDMPGRVLTEALEEDFLGRFPVRAIPSWD
jgi:hypothetical protein